MALRRIAAVGLPRRLAGLAGCTGALHQKRSNVWQTSGYR